VAFFFEGDQRLMQDLSAIQLKQLMDEGEPLFILDVREPHEVAVAHIEGSRHIPMNTIPTKLQELDPNQAMVIMCHHGMRSRMVGDFLESRGFTHIANLQGGIDAWSTDVDPSVPRY